MFLVEDKTRNRSNHLIKILPPPVDNNYVVRNRNIFKEKLKQLTQYGFKKIFFR